MQAPTTSPSDSTSLAADDTPPSRGVAIAPQTILVVGDASTPWPGLAGLLEPHAVMTAAGGADGLEKATQHQPDVVLLGLLLPDMTGFELLRRLKADSRTAHIAVVFVAGKDYVGDGVRGVLLGAADYVTTPFNAPVFAARLNAHLRLAAYRREVEELTQQDPLTGVANRRHFDRTLVTEAHRAQRAQTQLSVAMVNVDLFQRYNDRYGRANGDQALRAVARTLRTGIRRPADLVARYFGETFGVIIPETGPANALKVVQALRESVAALQIPHVASHIGPYLTVSIGLSTTEVGEDGDGEGVLQRASRSLSQAKTAGRNCVVADPQA